MNINIFTRQNNELVNIGGNSVDLRIRRMSRKLSLFFDFCKNDNRYAKSISSKGTYIPVFITLTYRNNSLWDKKDISRIIDKYRKYFTNKGSDLMPKQDFRYVWVAELQKRGVIHYHLVVWMPRFKKLKSLKPDALGWWDKGYSNAVAVRKSVFAYLMKYLSKGTSIKDDEGYVISFPKGARIYGVGGLNASQRLKTAYEMLPKWVTKVFIDDSVPIRRIKGGFKQGITELLSPYEIYEGGDWRDIVYEKKFSMIDEREYEVEWDELCANRDSRAMYFSLAKLIVPFSPEWNEFLLRG